MKRVGFLFEKAFSRENMYQAYLDASRGKHNKRACFNFERRLARNLDLLYTAIHEGTYRPQPYYMMQFVGAARGDDWLAMPEVNATMGALWMLGGNVLWYAPWLLGRFLIGYVVGAKR